ncbi:MAG: flippase-like domain-containing protein [Lachnospiraceae bacterium]|nr:flippase-like domain-containing protein [Lachnospiraceae bacterium]
MRDGLFLFVGSICVVFLFLLIHLLKSMRLYLVLLDERVEFKTFVLTYFTTTLLNLIIPFKLGEILRVLILSRITKSTLKGLFCTITDRFFDTLALVLIMLPLQLLYRDTLSMAGIFLSVFLLAVIFAFWTFPSAYDYLSKYIIINRSSQRSMAALKGLWLTKQGYDGVRKLVSGRYGLMTLLSFGAWIVEGMLLFVLSRILRIAFDAREFCEYIASILFKGHKTMIQTPYFVLCVTGLSILTIISFVIFKAFGRRKSNKEE